MACINPDGTLSVIARSVLAALERPLTMAEATAATGVPLYRIRATFRETIRAKLIYPIDERGEKFQITDLGREALDLDAD